MKNDNGTCVLSNIDIDRILKSTDEKQANKRIKDIIEDYLEDFPQDKDIALKSKLTSQKINITLFIDHAQNSTKTDEEEVLTWLAKEQGEGDKLFDEVINSQEAYNNADVFLQSLAQELWQIESPDSELVFCFKASLLEAIESKFKSEPLTLSADTICGLFDSRLGTGSLMGIKLKRKLTIPPNRISSIGSDGHKGYSINQVYSSNIKWESTLIKKDSQESKRMKI